MKMKSLLLTTALTFGAIVVLNAQTAPASVTDGSKLYQHGTNASGTVTAENVDSLTIEAANVKYLVYPDLNISPSYDFATSPSANLNSSFTWSATPNTGVTINNSVSGYASNYAQVTFGTTASAGDYTLSVTEKATTGSCDGAAKTIALRLVAKPTAEFGTTSSTSPCLTATQLAAHTLTVTPSLTSPINSGAIQVVYTITNPAGTVGSDQTVLLTAASSDIVLPAGTFTAYGNWKITIKSVSDRISRKSNVAGTVTNGVYTYTVIPTPVTGPIYHLPNN
jgi:hypothetical protein